MDVHDLKRVAALAMQSRGLSKKGKVKALARSLGQTYVQSSKFDALVETAVHGMVASLVHKLTSPVQDKLTRGLVGTSRHLVASTLQKL